MTMTVTVTNERYDAGRVVNVAWTSAADGSASGTIYVNGNIYKCVTNPGATAPSDNYDITLVDADGIDVAEGLLVDRDTANSEEKYLYKEVALTGAVPVALPVFHAGALTFTIANAGDSKIGVARIYYR